MMRFNTTIYSAFVALSFYGMTQFVYGDSSLPDTTMSIRMIIADVTCNVNDGQGLSKIVFMPPVYIDDFRAEMAKSGEYPLKIDCSKSQTKPDSIHLIVEPAGASSIVNASTGLLETDKKGVGLKLTWKSTGNPVSLLPIGTSFKNETVNGFIWDLSMLAKPIPIGTEIAKIGQYVGSVKITLRYA